MKSNAPAILGSDEARREIPVGRSGAGPVRLVLGATEGARAAGSCAPRSAVAARTSFEPPARIWRILGGVKRCSCGRAYDAEAWARLPLAGYTQNGRDAAGELLELRHCACGSTIAIDFGEEPDTDLSMACLKEPS